MVFSSKYGPSQSQSSHAPPNDPTALRPRPPTPWFAIDWSNSHINVAYVVVANVDYADADLSYIDEPL